MSKYTVGKIAQTMDINRFRISSSSIYFEVHNKRDLIYGLKNLISVYEKFPVVVYNENDQDIQFEDIIEDKRYYANNIADLYDFCVKNYSEV